MKQPKLDGSCHGRSASSWSDPHQAPPKTEWSFEGGVE